MLVSLWLAVTAVGQTARRFGCRFHLPLPASPSMQQQSLENIPVPLTVTQTAGNKEDGHMPEPRCFDEMTLQDGAIRPVYGKIASWLAATPATLLASRRAQ